MSNIYKKKKYEVYKKIREYNERCIKQQLSEIYNNWEGQYQYITKKNCICYKKIMYQKSCLKYKKISPKCISNISFFLIKLLLIILF